MEKSSIQRVLQNIQTSVVIDLALRVLNVNI